MGWEAGQHRGDLSRPGRSGARSADRVWVMSHRYEPRRLATTHQLLLRAGLHCQIRVWGADQPVSPDRPPLVLCHGWMDVGASFQFMVDAFTDTFAAERRIVALDWRGFGGSRTAPVDTYWFPDYLGDLDALLDALFPDQMIDLLGHSMGGNVVMSYAGVRPERLRRLVNLEGFGLPTTQPDKAPRHLARWLDDLKTPQSLRSYDRVEAVAERLIQNNPRLTPERAAWLAPHWAQPDAEGRWQILGDAAHKRLNAVPYQRDEVLACWRAITAPVLWVEGAQTDVGKWWGDRYPRAEFETRLAVVRDLRRVVLDDCAHMLHFDQPEALARAVEAHLR